MILSLTTLKGGVGKTTSAFFLAAVALQRGQHVTVIDADNEQSALAWWNMIPDQPKSMTVIAAKPDGLARQARDLERSSTVIIDTPPNSREMLNRTASVADHVIVPVKPTGLDVDRMRSTLELLADVDATRGGLDVSILFTHWQARQTLARDALEVLQSYRLPVLETKIRLLKPYAEPFGTIPTYLEEYSAVWDEIMGVTHEPA
jgi:chromosome partitioning protein